MNYLANTPTVETLLFTKAEVKMKQTNANIKKPETKFDALVLALKMAVTAPNEKQSKECVVLAEQLTVGMSEFDVKRAQKQAIIEADQIVYGEGEDND